MRLVLAVFVCGEPYQKYIYIYIIIEEKPICGSRSNGSCCWLLCFYRSMSCKPVVPGCSLIKTNVSLFPPFSNYLFIYLFCLTQQEHSIRALLGVLLVLVCQKRSAHSHGGLLAEETSLYAWRWLCYGRFRRGFCFLIFAPLFDCFLESLCVSLRWKKKTQLVATGCRLWYTGTATGGIWLVVRTGCHGEVGD